MLRLNKLFYILFVLSLLFSCRSDEENVDIQSIFTQELRNGSWYIDEINGFNEFENWSNEPRIVLVFMEDNSIKGRLNGFYRILEDEIEIDLQVIPYNDIFFDEVDSLDYYPSRYYQADSIFNPGSLFTYDISIINRKSFIILQNGPLEIILTKY